MVGSLRESEMMKMFFVEFCELVLCEYKWCEYELYRGKGKLRKKLLSSPPPPVTPQFATLGNWTALHKVEPQYNPVFDCRRIFATYDEKPLAGLFPIIRLRLITSMYRIQEMPRKLGR